MVNHTKQHGSGAVPNVSPSLWVASHLLGDRSAPFEVGTASEQEPQQGYHPTGWGILDRGLAFVDAKTGGWIGWLQRLFSFLFVGGLGALVNLGCFAALYYPLTQPLNGLVAYYIAFLLATELSIVFNFALNDRITFRNLHGHHRPWRSRCARFHLTSIGGALLTFVISFSCLHMLHTPAMIAQVIALVSATAFNFVFHHLFTYRHAPQTTSGGSKEPFEDAGRTFGNSSATPVNEASTSMRGSQQSMRTLIIIPTYNEAENLPALLEAILSYAPTTDVLIVDDNSPDGTGNLAEAMASKDQRIHVKHRPGKLGLGGAYIAGFKYSIEQGYDAAFEMDADFSHDPRYLPDFLHAIEQADLVIGSRYIPGGSTPSWSLSRRLISGSGNLFARVLLGIPVHDCTGGFRCYRREVLQSIDLETVQSRGYAFQVELTYRVVKRGFKIAETPIIFRDRVRGKSKMSRAIVLEAFTYVLRTRFGKQLVLSPRRAIMGSQSFHSNMPSEQKELAGSFSPQPLEETADAQRRVVRPVKLRTLR